ncbi:rho guanine nucleotide exchange factor 16 [Megalops cyprinoides]|uniref:rho guanine nucleotide exchange factor 16 n=1 Tax=Megalops cyprinoides TaxID=118141 RepID=UPI001864DA25|nr:rho guanine nucleotide exchange factor 16 [Megalops cyprinoides]
MSETEVDGSMGDLVPLLLERSFSSDLQLDGHSGSAADAISQSQGPVRRAEPSLAPSCAERGRREVVLSTQSEAALKLGTRQLIPRNLAVVSRTKPRHHTTVVTLPVAKETQVDMCKAPAPGPEVSWEDYDSDDEGVSIRRNRRNKSYRAAVTNPDTRAASRVTAAPALTAVSEEGAFSVQPSGNLEPCKRTLGRRRNQRARGSFKDEPRLYQEIRERGLHFSNQDPDDELLDDPAQTEPPSQDRLVVVKNYRPTQLTWSQLPQVQEMGVLQNISAEERKRQEAIFELITSEYSYQHSLGILVRQFLGSEDLRNTMTTTEHHHLFSNISVIQSVSQRFFEDLDKRHQDNPLIQDISDIVQNHATNHFQPYITYCSNETFQQRTLQRLLAGNATFREVLKRIENSAECGGLPVISFLILPMQRVTRLPLLMDTICQKTPEDVAEYSAAVRALKAISKLVKSCNDGARTMERTEQMYTIQQQLDFGKIKPFPLVSASRWLQKRGELAVCTEDLSLFWKAFAHKSYYLFLFNDVLIVTRRKSEDSYVVMDYATLENVEVELQNLDGQMPPPIKHSGSSPYTLKLWMKRNSEGRAEQIALAAESQIDRARWVTALRRHRQTDGTSTKEGLPQYEVTKAYMPKELDDLGLQQAEVVIVLQKEEGWCYGERMRDGERGWFPSGYANEITNRAAAERNVRRMERLRKETGV